MRILVIGNPISGKGMAVENAKKITKLLSMRGHIVELYMTRFAGDGKAYIENLDTGFDRIVVVGGDGTLNEIINGTSDSFSTPIVQIPSGNANLLGKELAFPKTMLEFSKLIETNHIIYADVAELNRKKFLMVAGVGFDAKVTEYLKRSRKGKINNFSYFLPILRALKSSSCPKYCVIIDNDKHAQGSMVLICNIRNYAGVVEIAHDANISSGFLDVIVFPNDNFRSLVKYFITAKLFKITKLPEVKYLKGKEVKISSKQPIPIEMDGDFAGCFSDVVIKLYPSKIPLLIPKI